MNRNERLRQGKIRALEMVSRRITLMGGKQVLNPNSVVKCALLNYDVKDPGQLELY